MKSFHRYTVRECGIFLPFMSEEWGTEWIHKQPTWDTGIRLRCTKLLKMYTYHIMATTICLCTEYINTPLTITFIKSFLRVTKNDCETYNSPNYGYASMLPLPCFPPLSLLLQKHINQKSIQRTPATQCTGGYPLTILTCLKFKFLLTFQFPNPQLGCQKITVRNSRPALPRIIPSLKGKQSKEQVVVGDFCRDSDVMSGGN